MKTIKLLTITICVAMLFACGSSSNSGGGGGNGGTGSAVTSAGGIGSVGNGGAGGYFYVESDAAIRVLASGAANPAFTMPTESTYNFGDDGYTVSGSEQILLNTTTPAHYTGLYMSRGNWNLYVADGTDDTGGLPIGSPVTGLLVPAGATLTISADNNHYGDTYLGAYLQFANDVVIEGTLQTATGFNYIFLDNTSGGKTEGAAQKAKAAADAGSPYGNRIIVKGTVTTSGADAGWIQFDADWHFYNSGTIDSSAGNNPSGNGYSSGGIQIYAYTGSIYSSGIMKTNGGNGGNGSGGNSYYDSYIEAGYNEDDTVDPDNGGNIILSGTFEARGGNAGGATGGNGGGSGWFGFYALGGDMIVNAAFNITGGNASGSGYTGGAPTGVDFFCFGEDYRSVGVCQISGSFNMSGGNGENGGAAGWFEVYSWAYNYHDERAMNSLGQAPDVELLGFANINLNGGNGPTTGGNASDQAYELYTYAAPYGESVYNPAYPIISEANVSAKGGNASAVGGTGGTGGYVELATDAHNNYSSEITTVTQSGTIDNSGGNATAAGGTGGNSYIINLGSGYDIYNTEGPYRDCWNVTTTGTLISNGGNGAAAGGTGGNIYIKSDNIPTPTVYTLTNLSVTGGTGTTSGLPGEAWVDTLQVLP